MVTARDSYYVVSLKNGTWQVISINSGGRPGLQLRERVRSGNKKAGRKWRRQTYAGGGEVSGTVEYVHLVVFACICYLVQHAHCPKGNETHHCIGRHQCQGLHLATERSQQTHCQPTNVPQPPSPYLYLSSSLLLLAAPPAAPAAKAAYLKQRVLKLFDLLFYHACV